jgi:hypothetical protein
VIPAFFLRCKVQDCSAVLQKMAVVHSYLAEAQNLAAARSYSVSIQSSQVAVQIHVRDANFDHKSEASRRTCHPAVLENYSVFDHTDFPDSCRAVDQNLAWDPDNCREEVADQIHFDDDLKNWVFIW